jgi:LVIVD repeat
MHRLTRSSLVVVVVVFAAVLTAGVPAIAGHEDDPRTDNIVPLGDTDDNRPVITFTEAFFTDIAFWGPRAYQGTWNGGFRVVDIADPNNPEPISEVDCGTFQGDVGVWENLVFRSIDTPVAATTPAETCDAAPAAAGFEGLQIFQVDRARTASADDLITAVGTDCGSHTHTVVPDPDNDRVLIYVSSSAVSPVYPPDPNFGNECDGHHSKFQIVEVPLDAPETASVIADVALGPSMDETFAHACHDIGVLQTRRDQLAVCAGNPELVVFDISDPANPEFVNHYTHPEVTGWHSAMMSWDGSITVAGWEPGGGTGAECEASDTDAEKSVFFYDTFSGELLGTWVLPNPQSAVENCTIHNYNVVPIQDKNVLVLGNYQAGTWVVDFTDPANATTVAWSDPEPLDPNALTLGGAWGSYWYNGYIYETNITEGLNIFRLDDPVVEGAGGSRFLNPQSAIRPHP